MHYMLRRKLRTLVIGLTALSLLCVAGLLWRRKPTPNGESSSFKSVARAKTPPIHESANTAQPTQYTMTAAFPESPMNIWAATPPYDYQYDNSIVYAGRSDGIYYMWSCGTGDIGYDAIKLMKSNDREHWTPPVVALEPTRGGLDQYAACNPTVFADPDSGYWYMLYTALTHNKQRDGDDANAIFAARALDPNGPWEKWNGGGWGGNPMWVIPPDPDCDAPNNCYGIGEPSAVHTWGGVYVFFTQWNHSGSYEAVWVFHEGASWPGQFARGHLVANKYADENGYHDGPWDVKLVVDNGLNKFMAIASDPHGDVPKVLISDDNGEHFYQGNPYVNTSNLHQGTVGPYVCQNTSIVGGPSGEYSDYYQPFIVCSIGPVERTCINEVCYVDRLYMQGVHLSW